MADEQLSILVIDEQPNRAEGILAALCEADFACVFKVSPSERMVSVVLQLQPDVIVMAVDEPTSEMLSQVSEINRQRPRPIVLFTMAEDHNTIVAAIAAGISEFVVDGLACHRVKSIVRIAMERFRVVQSLKDKLEQTRASLEDRKTLDRAKGIIMGQRNCTEPEAYRILQKLSMNRKQRMVCIARSILLSEEAFSASLV